MGEAAHQRRAPCIIRRHSAGPLINAARESELSRDGNSQRNESQSILWLYQQQNATKGPAVGGRGNGAAAAKPSRGPSYVVSAGLADSVHLARRDDDAHALGYLHLPRAGAGGGRPVRDTQSRTGGHAWPAVHRKTPRFPCAVFNGTARATVLTFQWRRAAAP